MSAVEARKLISMGLQVDADVDDYGTLASEPLINLISDIDDDTGPDTGLLEILASLARAAEGAADVHDGEVTLRLQRFAAHIAAARKEIE